MKNTKIEVLRRTFEAAKHPQGSKERAALNGFTLTSEYMTSQPYMVRRRAFMSTGELNVAQEYHIETFRTKREAVARASVLEKTALPRTPAGVRGELGAENPLRLPWRMFGADIYGFGVMNAEGEIQIGANTLNLAQAVAIVKGVNQMPHLMDALDDLHALSHGSIREHLTVENLAATMRARITTARAIAKAKGGAS